MQHAHEASIEQAPRARDVAVPAAASPEVALLFVALLLLALLVLLL